MLKGIVLLGCLFIATAAFGFGTGAEGCGGDCTGCHKVTKEEAAAIFSKLEPGMVVEDISLAPVGGLYQVTVKKNGQPGVAYLDFAKKHLVAGRIIDIASRADLTQSTMRKIEESTVIELSKLPTENTVVMGNRKGKKALWLFTDPECPYCGKIHQELSQLVAEDPQLKVYIVLNPLPIHPDAKWKSEAILCKARDNMAEALKMLEESYNKKALPKHACGKDYAGESVKLAGSLGLGTTPTLVLPNGHISIGAKKKNEIKALLEQALKAN